VETEELAAFDLLNYSPIDVDGVMLGPLFPVVHNQLLSLADVEGEAPHCQVTNLLPIVIVVGDQANHYRIVSKFNANVEVMCSDAVVGEQGVQEETKHTHLRGPVLKVSMADVLLLTLVTWGRPVRKSRIQL
jgi:hypothetical protein